MALKDKWVDKVDGVDIASAEDINQVAQAVIELERKTDGIKVPTKLSELTGDATHRTVTDAEKTAWNAKLGQSDLQAATNAALKQAKESGEFDGKSAYEYAQEGGYLGTEAEFYEALAKVPGSSVETTFEDIILVENAYNASTAQFNHRLYSDGSPTPLNGCVLLDYTPVKYDPDVFVIIDGIKSLGMRWDTRFTVNYYDVNKNALPLGQKAPSEFSAYLKNDFDGTLPCSFKLFKPANTTEGIENTEYVRIRVAITSDNTAIDASDCEGLVVKFVKGGTFSANAKGAPLHWKTAVAEKTEVVKSVQESGGKNCVSFAWASDTHMPDNDCGRTNYIGRVMGQMLDNCDIPFAVISGDAGTRGALATEAEYLECYEQMTKHLAPLWGTDRLLISIGNHDGCWGRDETASPKYYRHQFSPERMWSTYFRGQALDFRKVFSDNGLYYYIDNIPQKTRFIVLNSQFEGEYSVNANGFAVNNRFATSCYGQAQLDWLADVALDMPSGYGAIIFTHVPPRAVNGATNPYTVDYAQFNGIINAYCKKTTYNGSFSGVAGWTSNNVSVDFSNAQGEIIALFAGHIHNDTIDTETLECPIITIAAGGASANEDNPNYNRPFGTSLETSFDVVTINRASKMIYCTRLGAGSDRAISYTKTAPATYTVTWVVDGNTTTEIYTEGTTPSFKGSTDKASDGQYNYTFTGWSPIIAPVTGNVTYTAQYSKTAIVPDVKTYTVTNTLTNCSNSNSATTITEGSAYNATITANDGYTLDDVVVTMGGVNISHTFDDLCTINIGTVTGNIVITAVASQTPIEPSYTNLAEPNDTNTTDWSIWCNNARMGSDCSYRSSTNSMVTNYIRVTENDEETATLYFAGTGLTSAGNGVTSGCSIALYGGEDKSKISGYGTIEEFISNESKCSATYYDDGTLKTMVVRFRSDRPPYYLRFCLSNAIDKSKIIITKNEPIS